MILKINAFFESLATSNPLVIANYSWGDFYAKWSSGEAKYPHLNAFSATKSMTKVSTSIDLTVSMCDIVRNDESNLFEVENSTMNALRDIVNLMKDEMIEQNITINDLTTLTFFKNNGGDNVAGHYLTLNLTAYNDQSICTNIIGIGDWIPPTNECEGATVVNSDASYFQLIPSGGSLTVPDSEINLKDVRGAVLGSFSVPATTSHDIVVNDSEISSDGAAIGYLEPEKPLDILIKDQDGFPITPISSALAGGVATIDVNVGSICLDAVTTLNTSPFLTLPAGSTTDIELINEGGSDVVPLSVVGSTITLEDKLYLIFNFEDLEDLFVVNITPLNVGTFTSEIATNIGVFSYSSDGITFATVTYPFTPLIGTGWFKRSNYSGPGTLQMVGI